ncbi:hypothetical protein C8R44DRAFT_974767 [Mycena epipterygia]|nr:hypothetical protein C8R44DRAFT_974767 [Mycena epipterygia]
MNVVFELLLHLDSIVSFQYLNHGTFNALHSHFTHPTPTSLLNEMDIVGTTASVLTLGIGSAPQAYNTAKETKAFSWLKTPGDFEASADEKLKATLEVLTKYGGILHQTERLELQSRYYQAKLKLSTHKREKRPSSAIPWKRLAAYSDARSEARKIFEQSVRVEEYAIIVSEKAQFRADWLASRAQVSAASTSHPSSSSHVFPPGTVLPGPTDSTISLAWPPTHSHSAGIDDVLRRANTRDTTGTQSGEPLVVN